MLFKIIVLLAGHFRHKNPFKKQQTRTIFKEETKRINLNVLFSNVRLTPKLIQLATHCYVCE